LIDALLKAIGDRTGDGLLPFQIASILEQELSTRRWISECTESYIQIIRTFVQKNVIDPLVKARESLGMFDALEQPSQWDQDMDLNMGAEGKTTSLSFFQRLHLYRG
jgi:DNA-directed RNA polymerase III subunit RPC1